MEFKHGPQGLLDFRVSRRSPIANDLVDELKLGVVHVPIIGCDAAPPPESRIVSFDAIQAARIRLRLLMSVGILHLNRGVVSRLAAYPFVPAKGGCAAHNSPAEKL